MCRLHWARIGAGNTGPACVQAALGQDWCRWHHVRIGVGSTGTEIGADSTAPELVWTVRTGPEWVWIALGQNLYAHLLGQNWCREHQLKIVVDYTKQWH